MNKPTSPFFRFGRIPGNNRLPMPGGQLVQQGAESHRIVVIYDYYRFLQISSIEVSKEKQNVDPQCPPIFICLICVHPSSKRPKPGWYTKEGRVSSTLKKRVNKTISTE